MIDEDLATMYGVATRQLNQQVRRNPQRFPPDFMFRLTADEYDDLKSQFVTSRSGWGGRRKLPRAFTQEGVAMLSSVLNSGRAVEVNVAIMRAFVRLRRAMGPGPDLATRMKDAEAAIAAHDRELGEHAAHLNEAFAAIQKLGSGGGD